MWISRKKYNDLVNEETRYRHAYCDEVNNCHAAEHRYEMIASDYCIASQSAAESIKLVAELTKMLQQVIDITFENNKGFETVIFQRYGMEPMIFHKGKKIKLDGRQDVSVNYKNGRCRVDIKQTVS